MVLLLRRPRFPRPRAARHPLLPQHRGQRLRLAAEMKLPGRAWLEFEVTPEEGGATIRQTAEFDPAGLAGAATVGLTAGASVPEILVRDVVTRLGEFGFGEIEEVRTATEDIQFSLPKKLRSDLKAAGVQPDRPHKVREARR